MNTHNLYSALFGFPLLTTHSAGRIRERFGCADDGDALLWVIEQMRRVERLTCSLMRPYHNAPRIEWHCPGGIVIVRDGDIVVSCYREGEPDEEQEAEEVA